MARLRELVKLVHLDFDLGLALCLRQAAARLALLTTDPLEGLADVRIETGCVSKRRIEDRFHEQFLFVQGAALTPDRLTTIAVSGRAAREEFEPH
jgi:hypothetical protein